MSTITKIFKKGGKVLVVGGNVVKSIISIVQRCFYNFNGVNKYLRGTSVNNMILERTSVFSVDMWVYVNSFGAFVSKRESTTNNRGYQINLSDTNLMVVQLISSGSNLIIVRGNNTLTLNQWTHITVTYDGSSNASGVKLYFNGVLQPVTVLNNNLTTSILRPTLSPKLGIRNGNTTDTDVTQPFNGKITHFKFWYKELSQSEITEIVNKGSGNGVDYSDLSGGIYPRECEVHYPVCDDVWDGSKWVVNNVIDKTYTYFDGVNERIPTTNSTTLDISPPTSRSIVCWVNFDGGQNNVMFSKQTSGIGYFFNVLTDGTISFRIQRTSTNQIQGTTITPTVKFGSWNFIAISYNGTGLASGLKIYINDVPCTFNITSDNMGTNATSNSGIFNIGSYLLFSTPSAFSRGYMSNVAFFNVALSDANKTLLYNMGRDNPDYNSVAGLVSHWRLNQLNPPDIKGSNNGTSLNMDVSNIVNNNMESVNMDINDKETL
jgi:hypothetical protein